MLSPLLARPLDSPLHFLESSMLGAVRRFAMIFGLVLSSLLAVRADELHDAASRGDLATVNALLLAGKVDLDKVDATGTPLHHAIMNRRYAVAKRLIGAGASLNLADATFGTPLYLAVLLDD